MCFCSHRSVESHVTRTDQKIISHAIQFRNKKKTDSESDYIKGTCARVITISFQRRSKILAVTNSKAIVRVEQLW